MNQIEAGKIGIHTFTNATAYTVAETAVRVISIEFATKEENHAQFFGQVLVDAAAQQVERTASAKGSIVVPASGSGGDAGAGEVTESGETAGGTGEGTGTGTGDSGGASGTEGTTVEVELQVTWTEDGKAVCHVTFELNDEEILVHHPAETWHSGKHILSLYYPIEKVVPNITNTFNVYLRMEGGTGTVEVGGCIASISGQAMAAAAAWDGKITVEEATKPFVIGVGLKVGAYSEKIAMSTMELVVKSYTGRMAGRTGIGAFCRPVEL